MGEDNGEIEVFAIAGEENVASVKRAVFIERNNRVFADRADIDKLVINAEMDNLADDGIGRIYKSERHSNLQCF